MESLGVISKVSDATPWWAGVVVVPKKKGVGICVDPKALIESVLREIHPIPPVDDILAQISGTKLFSKLDANSCFWQIPLSPESRLRTTFITPNGRYCFNKLVFGISSAPEIFQKQMNIILEGLDDGKTFLIYDILVYGKDKEEHDAQLRRVLETLQKAGVTLNSEKCDFHKDEVKFHGVILNKDGELTQKKPKQSEAWKLHDQ